MQYIAVCVRGGLRTWDKCKTNIFKTCTFPDTEIDWFFDTWDSNWYEWRSYATTGEMLESQHRFYQLTNEKCEEIRNSFSSHNKNLVNLSVHTFKPPQHPHLSFLEIIYLSNLNKRKHELKTKRRYDLVLQIRPDCIYTDRSGYLIREGVITSEFVPNVINLNMQVNKYHNGFRQNDRVHSDVYLDMAGKSLLTNGRVGLAQVEDQIFYGATNEIDMVSNLYPYLKGIRFHNNLTQAHNSHGWHIRRYGSFFGHGHCSRVVRDLIIEEGYDYSSIPMDYFTDVGPEQHDMLDSVDAVWYGNLLKK